MYSDSVNTFSWQKLQKLAFFVPDANFLCGQEVCYISLFSTKNRIFPNNRANKNEIPYRYSYMHCILPRLGFCWSQYLITSTSMSLLSSSFKMHLFFLSFFIQKFKNLTFLDHLLPFFSCKCRTNVIQNKQQVSNMQLLDQHFCPSANIFTIVVCLHKRSKCWRAFFFFSKRWFDKKKHGLNFASR